MPKLEKKITLSGSLVRRVLLVCLSVLVLPLLIHTFLLYDREIELEEGDIRSAMRGMGATLAEQIGQRIVYDWKILDAETPALIKAFQIQKLLFSKEMGDHFVLVSEKQKALLVGKKTGPGTGHVIAHPLKDLLVLQQSPFPIDLSLGNGLAGNDQWTESFPIVPGLVLTAGTSAERIGDLQWSRLLFRIGSFLAIVFIFGGAILYWLIRKLNRPLVSLRLTMERVGAGAVHSRYTPMAWGFEINGIGKEFNTTLDQVLAHQKEAQHEKIEREKLAYELKIGQEIQASLLPTQLASTHGLKMAPGYLPAKEVSGDFYDVHPLSSGKVLIAMGDVSGKGISACLFSLGLRSSLRSLAEATHDLSQLARQANELFLLDVKESGYFATLWLGIYDGRQLAYASFGHPPALLKRGHELVELSTGHPAFGLETFRPIKTGSVLLEPGDVILLYTDGVTEAHDADQRLYGMERLKESFLKVKTGSPSASVNQLLDAIRKFSQEAPQQDDLALLWLEKVDRNSILE